MAVCFSMFPHSSSPSSDADDSAVQHTRSIRQNSQYICNPQHRARRDSRVYSRMQVLKSREPMFRALTTFAARDGPFIPFPRLKYHIDRLAGIPSLWAGLTASVMRQASYSSARFGLYAIMADKAKQWSGGEKLSMTWTIACAGAAGGLAGVIGNPAEVSPCDRCSRHVR